MRTRTIISIVFVGLGLIIAAVPQNTTHPYKVDADQLLEELNSNVQYVTPDYIADMLVNKDPSLRLIDVRNEAAFEKYSLPGAMNIPLNNILSDEWRDYVDQDVKMNVFYSNGTPDAEKAWILTRQLGYNNNYVLQGGLNFWTETIINPEEPASTSPNEEIAKYNFRKGAGNALGGEVDAAEAPKINLLDKPAIIKKPKKKRVQGGC